MERIRTASQSYSRHGAAADAASESARERDRLVAIGLPIVRRMAFRLARRLPPSVDVGDLIGAGNEGLLRAIAAYEPAKYPRFEPYAEARIRGAMLDELRAADPVTRHGRRRMAEVRKAIQTLTAELGRPPEEEEIAAQLGTSLENYQRLTQDLARAPMLGHVGEVDPDEVEGETEDAAEMLLEREKKELVVSAIGKLPQRTQQVLALYYTENCTQAEIGEILGVTEGRVCQILGDASARIQADLGVEVPKTKKRKAHARKSGRAAASDPHANTRQPSRSAANPEPSGSVSTPSTAASSPTSLRASSAYAKARPASVRAARAGSDPRPGHGRMKGTIDG